MPSGITSSALRFLRGVQQRGQRVRLASAERRHELEHPIARPAFQPGEHVLEQAAETLGQVGHPEEMLRVTVDGRHFGVTVRQRTQVQGEDVLGEVLRE